MRALIIYLLFLTTFFSVSCSKKDDAKPSSPSLDKVSLSLTSNSQVVEAPAGMKTSTDTQAKMASSWIGSVNEISNFFKYMKAPSSATKSSTRIVASNARVNTAGDVVVYTWSDGSKNNIAYQISETSDSYVFEIFLMTSGQTTWLKYFQAEEKKDQSSGSMTIYDIFFGTDPTVKLSEYTWSHSNGRLLFSMNDYLIGFSINLEINEKTKAGNVVYYIDGVKEYEMTWDATGSGTWTYYYDDNGTTLSETGIWTV